MATIKESSGSTKMYKCPMCDELCDTKAEARKHCSEEIDVVYICDICFEEFDNAKLAGQCCPEYVCNKCGVYSSDPHCPCSD